jgi:hypothetical protein
MISGINLINMGITKASRGNSSFFEFKVMKKNVATQLKIA